MIKIPGLRIELAQVGIGSGLLEYSYIFREWSDLRLG